jgi:hypothetical protein
MANRDSDLWLDAADSSTITIGTGVSNWADKSGKGNHGTQATTSYQPAVSSALVNGLDIVSFAGDGDCINLPTGFLSGTTELTIFIVRAGIREYNKALFGPADSYTNGLVLYNENLTCDNAVRANYTASGGADIGQTAENIIWSNDGAQAITSLTANLEETKAWKNGVLALEGGGITALDYSGIYTLGRYYASTYTSDQEVAEFIIIKGSVSTEERQQIEGYLAWKWGLEANLPSGHPYEFEAPTVFNPLIVTSSNKIKLTLDSSAVTTDQVDFPLSVFLDGTNVLHAGLFDDIGSNNMRLSIEAGDTQLPVEVESWKLDSETSLLIHSDTTEGSTVFTDSSSTPKVITPVLGVHHSTEFPIVGESSIKFTRVSSTSGSYLSIPDNEAFNFGSGDFTIGFRFNAANVADNIYFICQGDYYSGNTNLCFGFGTSSSELLFSYSTNGSNRVEVHTGFTVLSNVTYDILFVRDNGYFKLFVNGNLEYTLANTSILYNSTRALTIGGWPVRHSGGQTWGCINGYMTEIIIVKGEAVYSETYTPQSTKYLLRHKAVLHTKVPTYSASTDTELTISYDSTQGENTDYVGNTGGVAAQAVWDDYFVAVYHMSQDPSGGTGCIIDSTSNGYNGTPIDMDSSNLISGSFGKSISFDGLGEAIDFGDSFDDVLSGSTAKFSVEVSAELYSGFGTSALFSKYDSSTNNRGFIARVLNSSFNRMSSHYEGNLVNDYRDYGSASEVTVGKQEFAWTYDATLVGNDGADRIEMYLGGYEDSPYTTLYSSGLQVDIQDNAAHAGIGATLTSSGVANGAFLNGSISEWRLSSIVRSADWIKATRLSLTNQLIAFSAYGSDLDNTLILSYNNLLWDLLVAETISYVNTEWGLLGSTLVYNNWYWSSPIYKYYNLFYGDATKVQSVYHFYYWGAPITTKAVNLKYGCSLESIRSYDFTYKHGTELLKYLKCEYSLTGIPVISTNNLMWDSVGYDYTIKSYDFKYSAINQSSFTNRVEVSLSVEGVPIPYNQISIECSKSAYYISAGFTLNNPKYAHICKKWAAVEIVVQGVTYKLEIVDVAKSISMTSVTRTITCRSPAHILGASITPTSETEYDSGYCSDIAASIADEYGLRLNWLVYHKGMLVDQLLAAGTLYANDEKPIEVLRKIAVSCGGIIQSAPSGEINVVHKHQTRIPDLADATPDVVLNEAVRFRSLTVDPDEGTGENTVTVSSQMTSDETWSLEEEDGDDDYTKILKGYNTPWDSSGVELVTSGGDDVSITYLGIFEETYPDTDDDPEVVEFVNGSGSTDKYVYGKVSTVWMKDDLGEVYYDEDGTLTSEVYGESLLKIRYTIRYRKWRVTSATLSDVQFILRSIDE